MPSTIIIILLVLWAVGMVSSYTLGGLLHVLLALALIMALVQIAQNRSSP